MWVKQTKLWLAFGFIVLVMGSVACEWSTSEPPTGEPLSVRYAVRIGQALIGGKPDRSMTAVGGLSRSARGGTFCTATLIARRIVLTAGHCVSRGSYKTSGSPYFRMELPDARDPKGYKFVYYASQQVATHPKWRGSISAGNDIAVVILKKKVDPKQATPIRYNQTALDRSYVGKDLWFLGYGAIASGWRYPTVKYGAKIPITAVQSDRLIHRASGKSICFGDSGGPAMLQFNGQWRVVGVNSYVTGSCYGSGASTRTDTFKAFLEKYRKQYGESGSCNTDRDCDPCYVCSAQKVCTQSAAQKNPKSCKPCNSDSDCNGGVCHNLNGLFRCLQACSSNNCCPSNHRCDTLSGTQKACVPSSSLCPPALCQRDSDCGKKERCGLGLCGKVCQDKSDCPQGSLCRGSVCFKPTPSKVGESCASGFSCEQGLRCYDISGKKICSRACSRSAIGRGSPGSACGTNNTCHFDSQCIPLQGGNGNICLKKCSSTSDCLKSMTCKSIRGSSTYCFCQNDSECKQNEICNKRILGDYGACAPKQIGCEAGFACKDVGKGVTVCVKKASSNPCGNGICDSNENCSTCPQDCQCPTGQLCQNGTCQQSNSCGNGICEAGRKEDCGSCTQDCKCASGETCNNGKCQPTRLCGNNRCDSGQGENCSTCVQDCPCAAGKLCQSGACISGSQCGNKVCESTFGENCSTCPNDCGCPLTHSCFGGACIPVNRCGNGTCETNQGESCDLCPQDCGCPSGEVCQQGRCVARSGCRDEKDCPSGFQCVNSKCKPPIPGGSNEIPKTPDTERLGQPGVDAGGQELSPKEQHSPPSERVQPPVVDGTPDSPGNPNKIGFVNGPCRPNGSCDLGLQCAAISDQQRICLRLPIGADGLPCPLAKRIIQCNQNTQICRI